jgi:hypothetical protein
MSEAFREAVMGAAGSWGKRNSSAEGFGAW